jgi:hypothetical protein
MRGRREKKSKYKRGDAYLNKEARGTIVDRGQWHQ